jgi:tRNA 2-thiouridine synthesizing protein E
MQLTINNHGIELDQEGFLLNLKDWNPEVARIIAQQDGFSLSDEHWEIIYLARDFYEKFQISPAMRALVKRTEQILGPEKGKSIYLLTLFPPSPAKLAAKIAGLPKPANCF